MQRLSVHKALSWVRKALHWHFRYQHVGIPNANIVCVGSPDVGSCIGHVHFMFFVFISFVLGSQFPVEYGLKTISVSCTPIYLCTSCTRVIQQFMTITSFGIWSIETRLTYQKTYSLIVGQQFIATKNCEI